MAAYTKIGVGYNIQIAVSRPPTLILTQLDRLLGVDAY